MNDQVGRLKRLDEFTLADLESVRLILRGDSVIDWHRLHIDNQEAANALIEAQELRVDDPADAARVVHLKAEAISYLRRHFEFPIPRPIEQASAQELLLVASTKGHRQICACTVLKAMHIMHHLDGRELLFMLPLSDQEVFHLVEEKVYRVIGGMLAAGFPITEFVGGRKNKDSLYTKLLSKQDTIAAAIYDKLRFRIVTRSPHDILSVLLYLSQRLFPFNYVIPGESVNTIFHFKSYCERNPHLRPMLDEMQTGLDDDLTPGDNRFSAENYRTIHLVVDLPVRLPQKTLDMAPPSARNLGSIVYVLCEFQLIDQDTEASNELGEASHARYKERQKDAVMRRLKLGTRQMRIPGLFPPSGSTPPEPLAAVRAAMKSVPPPSRPLSRPPPPPPSGRSASIPPAGASGASGAGAGASGPKSVPPPTPVSRSAPPPGPKSGTASLEAFALSAKNTHDPPADHVDVGASDPYLTRLMRLFSGKVDVIASEVVRTLKEANDIECDSVKEVQLDVASVLNNYLRLEKESVDKAKELMEARGLGTGEFARMKKLVAEQKGIKVGDDTLDFLLDQIVEILMHSANVDEVFAPDVELRRKMAPTLKRHMAADEELEREVRGKLKHVQEGTRTWEVEYAKVMEEIKRRKGLD